MSETEELYVVRKGGAFYRPGAQGYTYILAEAGKWSKTDAEAYCIACDGVAASPVSKWEAKVTPSVGIFEFLEALCESLVATGQAETADHLRTGFARDTGGIDLSHLIPTLVGRLEHVDQLKKERDHWQKRAIAFETKP